MDKALISGSDVRLVGYPGNNIPEGTECGTFGTRDGRRIRYAVLRDGSQLKGTVCVLQGRGDFIERYFETMEDLRSRGYAIATFDWRGQGGSQRFLRNPRKCYVRDFREYDDDLHSFIEQVVLPDCPPPYYALAHSMGGCILLRNLRERTWFEKAVLTSPMFDVQTGMWPPVVARGLVRVLRRVGFARAFLWGERRAPMTSQDFEGNALTSDAKRFLRDVKTVEIAPELGVGAPTFGWIRAAFEAMREAMNPLPGKMVRVPTLVVAADIEKVTSTEACRRLATKEPNVVTVVVEHSRHEILMERDDVREQFWAAFEAFVEGRDPTLERSV
jgi:lysophospholipase